MAAKSGSVRRLQPKDQSLSPSTASSPGTEPKGKRRCVAVACIPCRKRKSKCDGGLPKCSTCVAVYKTDCSYDPNAAEASQRGATPASSKRGSRAAQAPSSAEYLVQRLLSLPENKAIEAVYRLRSNGDVDAIANLLRDNVALCEQEDPPSVERDHAHVKGDIAVDQRYRYGFSSGLGLVPTDDVFDPFKPQNLPTTRLWTDVTTDGDLVNRLIKLYFTWTNHFYPVIDEKEFYADFANSRAEACSVILVNAVCATGALRTDDPKARQNPDDPRTAGDHFFQRARQLLFEDEATPRLTTVQALQILSMREASVGRVSSGFRFSGLALSMAVELGMHLEGWKKGRHEDFMRRRSFWAMFNCDTAWSVCVGRAAMLPRAAVEIEKPNQPSSITQWQLYSDDHQEATADSFRPCYEQQVLYQQSSLTELLSEMLVIYYAPRERLCSRRILDLYTRFQSWYKQLPATLYLTKQSAPNVFQLHMWYWCCVNHLFRPIVRMKLVGSNIQPRKVCIDAAIQISEIMDIYRSFYPMKTVNLVWCHILLTAALTHIFDLPAKNQPLATLTDANHRALQSTAQCLQDLAAMTFSNRFAFRAIQIICAVAEKHGLLIQEDVLKESYLLLARAADPPSASTLLGPQGGQPSCDILATSASPAATVESNLQEAHNSYSYPPATTHQPVPQTTYNSHQQQHRTLPAHSPPIDSAPSYPTRLFFTPVDGQIGIPLYHNNPSQSHMDLNVMLGAVDWPEQLRQDGFELSDVWGSDPMAGTNQAVSEQRLHHPQQRRPSHQGYERSHGHGQQGYTDGGYANGWV